MMAMILENWYKLKLIWENPEKIGESTVKNQNQ